MLKEIITCIVLLGSAFTSQNATIYSNSVEKIEQIMDITLPCLIVDGESLKSAFDCNLENLEILSDMVLK